MLKGLLLPYFLLIFDLAECQQPILGNRVKITTECVQEQITLHIQFNENFWPGRQFSDWIIVGSTMRPECRLRGNGELRYIVQIAVLKDPCATKMLTNGVFQNTLRIASFPGLILSDDLNFEFKCVYGLPEVNELRLPQANRPIPAGSGSSELVPIRPVLSSSTIPSSSSPSSTSPSQFFLGNGNNQQQFAGQLQQHLLQQQFAQTNAEKNNLLRSNERTTALFGDRERETTLAERQRNNNLLITQPNRNFGMEEHVQQQRKAQNELVTSTDDFDVSSQWEERRNSLSSNVVVVMASLLGLFLVGCVFLAFFYSVKQYRAARPSPFAHLDSRTSPGNSSISPAGSEEGRECQQAQAQTDWRCSDSTANGANSNLARGTAQTESSYTNDEMNLEPAALSLPPIPSHNNEVQSSKNLIKAFGTIENGQNQSLIVPKMRTNRGQILTDANRRMSDNDAIQDDFNAAACRSITEIYKTAEMKLKSLMQEESGGGGGHPTSARGMGEGEYSVPKKVPAGKGRENELLNCVNKIRGYGTRKLTEQEILRWRQLVRNDANFQGRVFDSNSEEELMKIVELPQYRVLFTKLKWTQIMGCIAEEMFDGTEKGDERLMKPLPALPANGTNMPKIRPKIIASAGANAADQQRTDREKAQGNGSTKIFVGSAAIGGNNCNGGNGRRAGA